MGNRVGSRVVSTFAAQSNPNYQERIDQNGEPLQRAFSVTLLLPLLACSGVPDFDTLGAGQIASSQPGARKDVLPSDVIEHIKCELYYGANPTLAPKGEPVLTLDDASKLKGYVVSVDLYLKVDDNAGGSPTVNFIDPYATSMQSFSFGFNAQLGGTRERTYSQSFLITIDDTDAGGCAQQAKGAPSLNGINLIGAHWLIDVARFGLNSLPAGDKSILPAGVAAVYVTVSPDGSTVQPKPAFGSTVLFTLSRSIGLNPTWSFQQFKGPTGSGGAGSAASGAVPSALLGYGRTDTHELFIAFSYPTVSKPKREDKIISDAQKDLDAANKRAADLKNQRDAYVAKLPRSKRNLLFGLNDPFQAQMQAAANDAQRAQDKITTERQIQALTQQLTQPLSGLAGAAANNRGIIANMQLQGLPGLFVH